MTEYTITRFDPESGTIEVQFSNWIDAIAIPVTLDSMGMLPTGADLDALVGIYAPSAEEVSRRASVASATNQSDLSDMIGVPRTCGAAIALDAPAGLLAEITAKITSTTDVTPSSEVVI